MCVVDNVLVDNQMQPWKRQMERATGISTFTIFAELFCTFTWVREERGVMDRNKREGNTPPPQLPVEWFMMLIDGYPPLCPVDGL